MAKNDNIHRLDPQLIEQNTYDLDNDAVRVSLISAELAIEGEEISASGDITSSSTIAIPMMLCPQIKEFQIYAVAKTVMSGSVEVQLQYSPLTDGSAMVDGISCTLAAGSIGRASASSIQSALPKAIQVIVKGNNLTIDEQVTVHVIGNSF